VTAKEENASKTLTGVTPDFRSEYFKTMLYECKSRNSNPE
jgi:hypothetical protein